MHKVVFKVFFFTRTYAIPKFNPPDVAHRSHSSFFLTKKPPTTTYDDDEPMFHQNKQKLLQAEYPMLAKFNNSFFGFFTRKIT